MTRFAWLADLEESQACNAALLLMLYGLTCHGLTRDDALAVTDAVYARPDAPRLLSAYQVMSAYDEEVANR